MQAPAVGFFGSRHSAAARWQGQACSSTPLAGWTLGVATLCSQLFIKDGTLDLVSASCEQTTAYVALSIRNTLGRNDTVIVNGLKLWINDTYIDETPVINTMSKAPREWTGRGGCALGRAALT